MIDLSLVKLKPGEHGNTALDVNVDSGARHCGMCARDAVDKIAGDACDHCGYFFTWYQLLTDCTGLGDIVRNERELAQFVKKYKERPPLRYIDDDDDDYDPRG